MEEYSVRPRKRNAGKGKPARKARVRSHGSNARGAMTAGLPQSKSFRRSAPLAGVYRYSSWHSWHKGFGRGYHLVGRNL